MATFPPSTSCLLQKATNGILFVCKKNPQKQLRFLFKHEKGTKNQNPHKKWAKIAIFHVPLTQKWVLNQKIGGFYPPKSSIKKMGMVFHHYFHHPKMWGVKSHPPYVWFNTHHPPKKPPHEKILQVSRGLCRRFQFLWLVRSTSKGWVRKTPRWLRGFFHP